VKRYHVRVDVNKDRQGWKQMLSFTNHGLASNDVAFDTAYEERHSSDTSDFFAQFAMDELRRSPNTTLGRSEAMAAAVVWAAQKGWRISSKDIYRQFRIHLGEPKIRRDICSNRASYGWGGMRVMRGQNTTNGLIDR